MWPGLFLELKRGAAVMRTGIDKSAMPPHQYPYASTSVSLL